MKVTSNGESLILLHHIVEMMQDEIEKVAANNGIEPSELADYIKNNEHPDNPGVAALIGAFGMISTVHTVVHDVTASPNIKDLSDKSLIKRASSYRPHFWDELEDEQKIQYMKGLGRQ